MGTGYQADQFNATNKALASYAGRKCANPQNIRIVIERQKDVSIPIPTTIMHIDKEVENLLLGKDIDMYVKRSQQYRQNKAKICSVALGQCTEATKNRLEGEETYEHIDGDSGIIRLLLTINSIAYSYNSNSYLVLAIHMALRKFYTSYLSSSSSCNKYFKTMTNLRDVISHCGGVIVNHPFLVEKLLMAVDMADPYNPTEN